MPTVVQGLKKLIGNLPPTFGLDDTLIRGATALFPGEKLEFTGVIGERYAASINRFDAMVTALMGTLKTTYLPPVRVVPRSVCLGRNVLIELRPKIHYDYLVERKSRFGEAKLAHMDRAFRALMSPASPLRTAKRIRNPPSFVARIARDVGVPIEHMHSVYEGARAWLKIESASRKPRTKSPVKESLARAAIGRH